jgi:hypothetical protein
MTTAQEIYKQLNQIQKELTLIRGKISFIKINFLEPEEDKLIELKYQEDLLAEELQKISLNK